MDFDDGGDAGGQEDDAVSSFRTMHAAGDDTDEELEVIQQRWQPARTQLNENNPFEMAVRQAGASSMQRFENQNRCWGCQHAILSAETQNRSEAQNAIT
mgnify:CR=1 FL=1